jgi:hypothetical protein
LATNRAIAALRPEMTAFRGSQPRPGSDRPGVIPLQGIAFADSLAIAN